MIQATMPKPVARELRDRRTLARLSRRRLGEMAGVDQSTIYRAEMGLSVPDSDTLARLDRALDADGAILQSAAVTSPDQARRDTRLHEGGEGMADGFLEQALMSLAPEVRGHARLKAMRAALEVVESFLPGAALTRDSGAQ